MQRVIVINDNDDGTQNVTLHNPEKRGQELIVKRAQTEFTCTESLMSLCQTRARFVLVIECLPDDQNTLFTHYDPTKDMSQLSDSVLLKELQKRGCLVEETVYKRK